MTQEGLPTTRGLIESDVGPLRRFTGVLDSMPTEKRTGGVGEAAYEREVVNVNLKDIEVLEAVEPYHFPTYTIMVGQSNRKKSKWGFLSEGSSEDRTVGFNNVADQQYSPAQLDQSNPAYVKPAQRTDLKDCTGKRIGFVMADGDDGRPHPPMLWDGRANDGKGGDTPSPSWTIYSIEGIGVASSQGQSAMDLAMSLLDGKTLANFNDEALKNTVIRNDADLLQAISKPISAPDSFANTLVTAGKFTKDEQEVYHIVS